MPQGPASIEPGKAKTARLSPDKQAWLAVLSAVSALTRRRLLSQGSYRKGSDHENDAALQKMCELIGRPRAAKMAHVPRPDRQRCDLFPADDDRRGWRGAAFHRQPALELRSCRCVGKIELCGNPATPGMFMPHSQAKSDSCESRLWAEAD
jgi:hypothetical protein